MVSDFFVYIKNIKFEQKKLKFQKNTKNIIYLYKKKLKNVQKLKNIPKKINMLMLIN